MLFLNFYPTSKLETKYVYDAQALRQISSINGAFVQEYIMKQHPKFQLKTLHLLNKKHNIPIPI